MAEVVTGSSLQKTPVVRFTKQNEIDVPDTWFVGLLQAKKPGKRGTIFEFVIESAHPKLSIAYSLGNKQYEEAKVEPGSRVTVFGTVSEKGVPNQLEDKIKQVPENTRVKIFFNGKKLNPKSGREYNDFTVLKLVAGEDANAVGR